MAFATAAARESYLSEPPLLSPRYLYHFCKQTDGIPDIEGTYLRVAVQLLLQQGTCREEKWPYGLSYPSNPPESSDEDAERFRIDRFVRLDDTVSEITLRSMKFWLATYGPLVAGVQVHEGWCKRQAVSKGEISDPAGFERRLGGHAICVVGYDDDGRYFIFKNSWGEDWGDGGYGYLPYQYVASYCFEAWGILPESVTPR